MNKKPDDIIIQRVLNNRGTTQEAKDVVAWFETEEGQQWLSVAIEKDAMEIDRGRIGTINTPSVDAVLDRINRRIRQRRVKFYFGLAAAVVVPCFLMIGMWMYLNNRVGGLILSDDEMEIVEALPAKKKEIFFQDGSYVILNSASRIVYPHRFGLSERRVQLFGEAYFNIKSNSLRPFIVELEDKSNLTVLGTTFNVEAYSNSDIVKVELIEGALRFQSIKGSYQMRPNDRLIYSKENKSVNIIHGVSDIENSVSWRDDILMFKDTPLREVLSKLERGYGTKFIITSNTLKSYTFTMRVDLNDSLSDILKDIESISDLKFEKAEKEEGYIVKR